MDTTQAIAAIISGIFSEYGALVGGMMLIIIYLAKKCEKLEDKNDALEKEIRDTMSGVITQNTLTFQRVESSMTNAMQNRVPVPQIEYLPEQPAPRRRARKTEGESE